MIPVIQAGNPVVVGFSLIFQFYLPRFRALMRYLRDDSVQRHFTIGGHFPSLNHERTLELVPEVESVVRFEGELTGLELVGSLIHDRGWQNIAGIAHRKNGQIVANPLRPLLDDLDTLPFPHRQYEPTSVLGSAPNIALYYQAIGRIVGKWVNGPSCIAAMINHAWHETFVMERAFAPNAALADCRISLSALPNSATIYSSR